MDALQTEPAEVAYTNGRIYTVNEGEPWVEAVAIKDGRFVVVGSNEDVAAVTGPDTEVINLQGGFALPGLIDVHAHPSLLMEKRAFCELPGTFYEPTEADILGALTDSIANYPEDQEWFIGHGFSTPAMSPETLTRAVLDKLIPDKPAYIEDEGGHNAWFNTKAMELAGVTAEWEDTPEVFFSRTESGDLAGVAYEGAMNPFLDVLPAFDIELSKLAFTKFIDQAVAKGVTAMGDAYTFERQLPAWEALHREGRIHNHINLYLKGNLGTAELTPVEDLIRQFESFDLPGHRGVKVGMGGAIESVTSPLVDGYRDPANSAETIIATDVLADYVTELDAAGFQLIVHAIGDGTVRATIDGFEPTIRANNGNPLRHRIDHCSLVHPDDFGRLVELDIAGTIWPPLNAPVAYNTAGIRPMLKDETWARMYANRDMWDAGIRLANHSDAPAAVLWPWWGIEATITRGFPGKPELGKLGEDQALTLEESLQAHTINAAWSLHLDEITGSIEVGKSADMILLDRDLFDIPVTDIHETFVLKTMFKGKVVYQKRN